MRKSGLWNCFKNLKQKLCTLAVSTWFCNFPKLIFSFLACKVQLCRNMNSNIQTQNIFKMQHSCSWLNSKKKSCMFCVKLYYTIIQFLSADILCCFHTHHVVCYWLVFIVIGWWFVTAHTWNAVANLDTISFLALNSDSQGTIYEMYHQYASMLMLTFSSMNSLKEFQVRLRSLNLVLL